jgi:ComEC/Rec2-related protein
MFYNRFTFKYTYFTVILQFAVFAALLMDDMIDISLPPEGFVAIAADMKFSINNKSFLCVASLLAGESAGFALGKFSSLWVWMFVGCILSFLFLWGRGVKKMFLPFVFCVGCVLGARSEDLRRRVIFEQEGGNGPPGSVILRVESEASAYRRRDGLMGVSFYSRLGNLPVKVSAPLLGNNQLPQKGEEWECRGRLASSNDTSSRKFARRSYWIGRRSVFKKVENSSFSKALAFYGWLNYHLSRVCDIGTEWCPEIADLNKAMLLGNRSLMSKEMNMAFSNAGTIHVFAISGLHIVLVSGLLRLCLQWIGFTNRACSVVLIPLLVSFVILSGLKPSAIRALIMMSLVCVGELFGRKADLMSAWSMTAIFVYGFSPEMLFEIGCMFSFVVMLGIVLILEASKAIKRAMVTAGNLKTADKWADSGIIEQKLLSFKMMVVVSFAAWVMSVPVCAMNFGRISFGGLLANMVIIPLAGMSLRFGFYALLAGVFNTPLVALLNNLSALITWCMVLISTAVAKVKFSFIDVKPWSFIECFMWYGIWFLIYKISIILILRKISGKGKWW